MPETLTGPLIPTDADMQNVHYGIAVADIGDDGDMIALGHHDFRRVLAAFNRHARTVWGLHNVWDTRSVTVADVKPCIQQRWGVFAPPDPEQGDDTDCPWYVDWSVSADAPNAIPVTVFRA